MVHLTIPCPDPEPLSPNPKDNTAKAPQRDQAHVSHDRRNISITGSPSIDKFRESVTPNVLVNCNANEHGAGNRLVRVNCISRGDGRESRDLDAGTRPANNYDRLVMRD